MRSPRSLLLDLRPSALYVRASIPGSLNIPGFFSPELMEMAGFVRERSIYLLTDSAAAVQRATENLEQFDDMRAVGWFRAGAIDDWRRTRGELVSFESIDPDTLAIRLGAWKTVVVDVRGREAFRSAHIPDSIELPLRDVGAALAGLPRQTHLTIVCEEGDVCAFAAGLLWRAGYANVAILRGGFAGYAQHGFRVERGGR